MVFNNFNPSAKPNLYTFSLNQKRFYITKRHNYLKLNKFKAYFKYFVYLNFIKNLTKLNNN